MSKLLYDLPVCREASEVVDEPESFWHFEEEEEDLDDELSSILEQLTQIGINVGFAGDADRSSGIGHVEIYENFGTSENDVLHYGTHSGDIPYSFEEIGGLVMSLGEQHDGIGMTWSTTRGSGIVLDYNP